MVDCIGIICCLCRLIFENIRAFCFSSSHQRIVATNTCKTTWFIHKILLCIQLKYTVMGLWYAWVPNNYAYTYATLSLLNTKLTETSFDNSFFQIIISWIHYIIIRMYKIIRRFRDGRFLRAHSDIFLFSCVFSPPVNLQLFYTWRRDGVLPTNKFPTAVAAAAVQPWSWCEFHRLFSSCALWGLAIIKMRLIPTYLYQYVYNMTTMGWVRRCTYLLIIVALCRVRSLSARTICSPVITATR